MSTLEFRLLMRDIDTILRDAGVVDCTCPCLDCLELKHCGGPYIDDDGVFVGECHEVVDERSADDWYPQEDNE